MKRWTMAVLLVVAAAACGGSTPTGSGGSPTPDDAGIAAGEFSKLLKEGFSDADFRISYELTTGGETTNITWAQQPPKRSFRVGEGAQAFFVIDDGTDTILCTGRDVCIRSEDDSGLGGADAFLAPLFELRESILNSGALPGFTSKGSKTIAGRAASCGSWTYGGQSTEVCVDAEVGILLSWGFSGDPATSAVWRATDFGAPEAADFEPTAPIRDFDIPTIPGTGG